MPAADAVNWFGKVPPDLSLITRSKGTDYVYRLLKTFYADPTSATGSNNLAYPGLAMPAVLSDLERSQRSRVQSGQGWHQDVSTTSRPLVAGSMTARAIRPVSCATRSTFSTTWASRRRSTGVFIGIWVVLFLVLLTWLAWLLKNEYWKDVH